MADDCWARFVDRADLVQAAIPFTVATDLLGGGCVRDLCDGAVPDGSVALSRATRTYARSDLREHLLSREQQLQSTQFCDNRHLGAGVPGFVRFGFGDLPILDALGANLGNV